MNTPETEITKFKIIVIEWLRETDRKTGLELYRDILKRKEMTSKVVQCKYYSVTSKEQFAQTLHDIHDSLMDAEILTLQIESHGCAAGIGVSDVDIVTWEEFYDLIRPINIKTCNLLFVCLSMCLGIGSLTLIDPSKRAPYLAMMATTGEMYPDDLYDAFVTFYETYNNILDISAFRKISRQVTKKDGSPAFVIFSAADVFDRTFDINRDPQNTKHLINELYVKKKTLDNKYTKEKAQRDVAAFYEEAKSNRDFYCFNDMMGKDSEIVKK